MLPARGYADLQVSLDLEHYRLVRFEPINAFITIVNKSATPYVADSRTGASDARLRFEIYRGPNDPVQPLHRESPVPLLVVAPGEEKKVLVQLSRWYDLTPQGGYNVTVAADWRGRSFLSRIVRFEVENGIPLANVIRSVPDCPEMIWKYSLRYLAREGMERLFLSVDEEEDGVNHGVFDLGRLVRVSNPRLEVTESGTVMVVHQSGKDCFVWSLFKASKDGVVLVGQSFHREDGSLYPITSNP